jgi:hypothetical protein
LTEGGAPIYGAASITTTGPDDKDETMRAELQTLADDIRGSLSLLRRHL